MRPIPIKVLCDTATIEEPDTSGRYGDSFLPKRTIEHVYLEQNVSSVSRAWADDRSVSCVLVIDATNSTNAFSPALLSRVTVGNVVGSVIEVKEYRPYGLTHHWEVALG